MSSNTAAVGVVLEVRDYLNMTYTWFNKLLYKTFTAMPDDEALLASNSTVSVALDGAAVPGSPFRPTYVPGPLDLANSVAFQQRTPFGYTKVRPVGALDALLLKLSAPATP